LTTISDRAVDGIARRNPSLGRESRVRSDVGSYIVRRKQEIIMATQVAEAPEFRNASDLEFTDISSEQWREYQFMNGETVRIEAPLKLNVSGSGGHRIFDEAGVSHYIPAGWIHLMWVPKGGEPNFVK
jgi:hypothetical protein